MLTRLIEWIYSPMVALCTPKDLPPHLLRAAAAQAVEVNPANAPVLGAAAGDLSPDRLAVLTTKYWGVRGVDLSVSFLDSPAADLRDRILAHMNSWGEFAAVRFRWSTSSGQVRISRARGGYWSYLGTDLLSIPTGEPTMNLEGFTMRTSEAEFTRVVRHETGHTLGMPHEHLRAALVARLDPQKTVDYFRRTQGWSEADVRRQVLTPLAETALIGTDGADADSIMCYQLPGSITRDGQPIAGGRDFSAADRALAARVYPRAGAPAPPGKFIVTIEVDGRSVRVVSVG